MRRIERTTPFKKDYKREIKGRYRSQLASELIEVVHLLINDLELPARYFDHALFGWWKDFRDRHIKPDLLLIYAKPSPEIPILTRLASHSELSL